MNKRTAMSIAAAALFLCGTVAQAADVRTDFDHSANFSSYHTYSYGKVQAHNPLNIDRVKDAINKDLQARGWQLVPSGGSATVFATDNVKNEKEMETMYDGMGGGWGGGWGWGGWGGGWGGGGFGDATTTTTNQRVGHLVVDIFDASNQHLLFRGIATSDLSENSGKNTKTLEKDLDKKLKDFPPKSKN